MNQSFLIFAVSSVIVPVIVGSISAYITNKIQDLIFCFRGAYHYLFSEKYIDDLQDVNHCKDELNEAFSNLYFEIYNRLLSAKKELGY